MIRASFATLLIAVLLAACQPEAELDRGWMGSETQPTTTPDSSSSSFEDDELSNRKSKKDKDKDKGKDRGKKKKDDKGSFLDEYEGIEYPSMSFTGRGTITNEGKSYLMEMATSVSIDDRELIFDTQRAKVHFDNREHQAKVDRKVQRSSIGQDVYQRTPKRALKEDDRLKEGMKWAVFADEVQSKRGVTFKFSDPLPVYPWPAPESRYEGLTTETFEATVTTDRPIAASPDLIHEEDEESDRLYAEALRNAEVNKRIGRLRDTFNVVVTITKKSVGNGQVVIDYELTIKEEGFKTQGLLYEQFPLAKRAVYTIETEDRIVKGAHIQFLNFGDRSRRQESSQIPMQICTREYKGETTDYPCHRF